MKKNATRITGIRFSEATYKAVVQAARTRDYASPSAFMRAAVEKELRGADATLDESEQRISASLEKYSKQVRRVSTGQQALFAYMDALAKVILSTLPDTDEDTRKEPTSREESSATPDSSRVLEQIWRATPKRRSWNW
jgi:hypothetical protein